MRSNCKKINRTCRFTLSKWFSCFPFGCFQWWGRETELGCRRVPLLDGTGGAQRRTLQWKGQTPYDSLPRCRPESFSVTLSPTLLIRLLSFHNFKSKIGAIIPIDWECCSAKFILMYRVLGNHLFIYFLTGGCICLWYYSLWDYWPGTGRSWLSSTHRGEKLNMHYLKSSVQIFLWSERSFLENI